MEKACTLLSKALKSMVSGKKENGIAGFEKFLLIALISSCFVIEDLKIL